MSQNPSIYTGVWRNWNHNAAKGATLTLKQGDSAYLVAFLALFIGLVAGHFWALICYAVFQIRSTKAPRTGLHHTQQAILRNYHAPGTAVWQLLKSMWFWRKRKGASVALLAVPVLFLAAMSIVLFAAAGILSSQISSKGSEVLVSGSSCGFWNNPATADPNAERSTIGPRVAYFANLIEDFGRASTIAAQCSGDSSVASECVSYAPEKINYTTTTNHSCPFQSKMCMHNKVVRFDSGLMDSMNHLGINSLRKDRISFRRVTECAPITREGYMEDWHSMAGAMLMTSGQTSGDVLPTSDGEQHLEFFYGPNHWVGLNSTFIHSDAGPRFTQWGGQMFLLQGVQAVLNFPPASHFTPIEELNRTDADVNLLFLDQEKVEYTEPVNDPWFEAKRPKPRTIQAEFGVLQNVTTYIPEWPVSVVGCANQYQFCDSRNRSHCTELSGLGPVFAQAKGLFDNTRQKIVLERMRQVAGSIGDMSRLASALAGSVLAVNNLGAVELSPVPDDQWIRELSHMFATLLTVTQIRNYRYTGGYDSGLKLSPAITPPLANETWMCGSQIVRRDEYNSFSVLGLSLTVGFGGIIILLNLTMEPLVKRYQKRYQKRVHACLEWDMLETQNLQRQAYKLQGVDLLENSSSIAPLLETKGSPASPQDGSTVKKLSSPQIEQREVVESGQNSLFNHGGGHGMGISEDNHHLNSGQNGEGQRPENGNIIRG